jgi:hypothetical protein
VEALARGQSPEIILGFFFEFSGKVVMVCRSNFRRFFAGDLNLSWLKH